MMFVVASGDDDSGDGCIANFQRQRLLPESD
jgi:hypothetical protein